jgi:biotin carboxylase
MTERKRLLLVAATTGYQTRVFADAARRMGVEVVLATDRCHVLEDPWGDRAIPVRFDAAEESAAALVRAGRGPFDAIVAVGDRPTYLAALIAEHLGLPFSPPDAVRASGNKFLARERFRLAGLRLPHYYRLPLTSGPHQAAREATYPCVLKPLGLSASRGVIRADNEEEFVAAFRRIEALLREPDIRRFGDEQDQYLQIESFIEGREFALEGLVTKGQLEVLALFDKPDPLNGPYFEETVYVTPSRESEAVQQDLIVTAGRAVRALGLTRGPVHAELRYNREGAWILEVAARPIGGLCAKALRFEPDVPLEEVIMRHALGEDVAGVRRKDPASGVMMIPIPRAGIYRDVTGLERAVALPGVYDVHITAKRGQKLVPLPEGSSYLGFLFARGNSPDEVERSLRNAHAKLEFEILPVLPVVPTA